MNEKQQARWLVWALVAFLGLAMGRSGCSARRADAAMTWHTVPSVVQAAAPTQPQPVAVEAGVSQAAPSQLPDTNEHQMQRIRFSRYDPALGGTNCFQFVNGVCVSTMANGEPWAPWMEKACACPPEWPFGTQVILDGKVWICKDRGSAIKTVGGIPWVDFLTRHPRHAYGEIVTVQVIPPGG